MQVWQLIQALSAYPACADVKLRLDSSGDTDVVYVEKDNDVRICGADASIYDLDGEPIGLVSEMPEKIHEARKLEKLLRKVKLRL